ncbi:ABC transporter permease [Halobellus rufus]|uniref:ABC transporter permease n=1 Tax=Halobellus rufus TaxID=1448860 RepID=UPI000678DC39|nr:ABC transporter permease [Halobellus rufus]
MSITELLWRFPSVQMAWRNLGRNRVRTALAMLGIVIGVVAIASLGIAGVAIQQQATANLGSLTDEVMISAGPDSPEDGITEEQVTDIRSVAGDATVVPEKTNHTTLETRDGREVFVGVTGLTQASAMYTVSEGENPDRLQSGALLSNSTAQQLDLELGDPVEYDGQLYRIRGFVESQGGFGRGGRELVLPVSALSEQEYYGSVTIITEDGDQAQEVANALEARFNEGDDEVLSVTSFAAARENVGSFMNTLNLALLGIGSISLVVASVAILNVMLMSTIERRGEIGVLRAVGIRRGEILRMILAEATFLGIIGGFGGALASVGVGLVIFQLVTNDPMLIFSWPSLRYLLLGFGFAVVASMLSGLYPAWKAANDPPVEALRG